MWTVVALLVFSVASVLAGPTYNDGQRIVGGSVTTIDQHPYMAAMLRRLSESNFMQNCGGTILNERTILSAAHCYVTEPNPNNWQVRVGSTFRHSGGTVHNLAQIFNHPAYDPRELDHDISVLHLATSLVFNDLVQAAQIPPPNYVLPDNTPIWSIGWGQTQFQGVASDQLKHILLSVTNQNFCQQIHGNILTDTMLCLSGDGPNQGTCQQDSGGPNIQRVGNNNIVVGVTAFGVRCGEAQNNPDVTMRVSKYFDWIMDNAFTG